MSRVWCCVRNKSGLVCGCPQAPQPTPLGEPEAIDWRKQFEMAQVESRQLRAEIERLKNETAALYEFGRDSRAYIASLEKENQRLRDERANS
jgi:FtsZ-binding cell division protein ZapB